MDSPMYYDPDCTTKTLLIRYAIGGQEREALVLANGFSVKDHVDRVQTLTQQPQVTPTTSKWVPWPLAAGGMIAIRLDSIIAIEGQESTR
ncbi:hypothetical protein ACIP3B_36245 [Streptomyces anulatus]|uniref:hypothetical protein n=1 Tax=Streptomyces anulatus TaxID=1892 RepID=UPI0033E6B273